jgi:hypothetical protein
MNKRKQGIEVNLSVIAISAILVTALFVMSSSGFMPNAMAQGLANQTGAAAGGLANQTGAAAGGLANQTGAAAGGLTNQTGAAAGGLTNQTGGLMIPEGTAMEIVSNLDVLEGAVGDDEEAMTAVDAIRGALEERAMQAGMTLPEPAAEEDAAADEGEDAAADEGEDAAADEDEDAAADEGEDAAADEGDDTEGTTGE